MGLIDQLAADVICLKGALRALRMTTQIAKNPTRVFPARDRGTGREVRRRARRCSPTARASAIARLASARTAMRAGRCARRPRKGRHRLPADAEPAGIHGGLARHHPRRRRHRAGQHQPDRAVARPLHRHRLAEARHRGGRACSRPFDDRPAADRRPRRRSGRTARAGDTRRASIARSTPCPASRSRTSRAPPRSPSRTARSTSTPPAPPACRRRPTSTTTA